MSLDRVLRPPQTGPRNGTREPAPRALKLAAAMFVLYGIATVLNTVVFPVVAGTESVGNALRMLLPLGAGFVAYVMFHGRCDSAMRRLMRFSQTMCCVTFPDATSS